LFRFPSRHGHCISKTNDSSGGRRGGDATGEAVLTPGARLASLLLVLVRIVIARCSVDYTGRLSAHLPLATRLIIIKADGSLVIHNDAGTKALNWMPTGSRLTVAPAQAATEPVQESDSDGGASKRTSGLKVVLPIAVIPRS
jgi:hypothetical protein